MLRTKYLLFILFWFISFSICSQNYSYKQIAQKDGLPTQSTTTIYKDSRGLFWIGNNGAGLNLYNGHKFITYNNFRDTENIFVEQIIENHKGQLLISDLYKGIFVFDKNRFVKQILLPLINHKPDFIQRFIKVNNGIYAISARAIYFIDTNNKVKRNLVFPEKEITTITGILKENNSSFYFSSNKGVFYYDGEKVSNVKDLNFDCVFSMGKKPLLGTSSGNLYSITKTTNGTIEKTILIKNLKYKDKTINFKHITTNESEKICFSIESDNCLGVINSNLEIDYTPISNSFKKDEINCLFVHKEFAYFSTETNGIIEFSKQKFQKIQLPNEFSNDLFYANCKIQNDLYVYSKNEGIKIFKESSSAITYHKTLPNSEKKNILIKNNTNQLVVADNEAVYVYENGYFLVKTKLKGIKSVFQDSKSRYWISSTSDGVLLLDKNFNKITHFFPTKNVQYVIEGDKNQFYIGLGNGIYEAIENQINTFQFQKIAPNFSYFATKDSYGTVWISAESKLLSIAKDKKIHSYNSTNKIRSTLIYTLKAHQNYIYVGSNLGIDKIKTYPNGTLSKIKSIERKYGFNNLETNTNGCSVDPIGNLYFSTNQGLFKYSPSKNDLQLRNENILISNFILGEEEGKYDNWVNIPEKKCIVNGDIDDVKFQIGQTNSLAKTTKYYSAFLKNYSKNWSNPNTNTEIAYYQLEPGDYEFQVKEVTIDGDAISKTTTFPFSITIPFYNTWWFLGFVLWVFGFLAYYILTKTAIYKKEFVSTHNIDSYQQINQNVLLSIGLVLFAISIISFSNGLVTEKEFFIKTLVVAVNILIYFFYESKLIKKHFNSIVVVCTFGITFSIINNLIFEKPNYINYSELLIISFFSYNLIYKFKHYIVYSSILMSIFMMLFLLFPEQKGMYLSLIGSLFLITVINFYRRVNFLNINDKLLFTNKIINESNVLTIASDNLGDIKYCSNSIRKILGYTETEVLGINFWKLTLDEEFESVDYNLKYTPNTLHIRKLKCKDNTFKYIEWNVYKNDTNLFVSSGVDVTQRIESENYQNIVTKAADIIYEMDNHGNITYINEAGLQFFNTSTQEMYLKNLNDFLVPEHKERILQFYAEVENKTEFDLLELPVLNQEKIHWFSQKVVINRNLENKIIGYSAIVRDITNSKNEEERLRLREHKTTLFNTTLNILTTKNYSNFESLENIIQNILVETYKVIRADRVNYWENKPNTLELLFGVNKKVKTTKTILDKRDLTSYYDLLYKNSFVEITSFKNTPKDSSFINNYIDKYDIKSLLDFPIYIQGELIGIICFETTLEEYKWDRDEINFAKTITDIITLNIESFYKREAQKQTIYKSEILFEISNITKQLLISNDLKSIFTNCRNLAENIIKIDRFYYYENTQENIFKHKIEWDISSQELVLERPDLQNLKHEHFPIGVHKLLENKPVVGNLSQMSLPKDIELFAISKAKSKLIFPIFKNDELIGTIGFDDQKKERIWLEEEKICLQLLANNISATLTRIENQNIFEEKRIAEAANQSKSEFLANMSHEIRTPLNGIIGFSELLLNTEINLTQKEYLQTVNRSASSLLNIVNDILDISKIEAGKLFLDVKETKLIETIYKVIELVKFDAHKKNIELIINFKSNVPHEVIIDDFRLKQILINLLNNAVKFTLQGEIEIVVSVITIIDNRVKLRFEVIDSGIGIKPENKSKILSAFAQEDTSTTRNYGGTGLGLSITNNLLQLMNSTIQIENVLPNGSNFYFDLDLQISPKKNEFLYTNHTIKNAVIIDKNQKSAHSLITFLEKLNINCTYFNAFEKITLNNNDLLFVNYTSVTNQEWKKIEVLQKNMNFTIFITHPFLQSTIEKLLSDTIKFISKPFHYQALLKQIEKINNKKTENNNVNTTKVKTTNSKKIIILIVEDNSINMLLAKTLVSKSCPNAIIIEAQNGQIGVDKFIEYEPEIVLMDLQMPIKNGYEASKEILKNYPNARIIAITAGIFKGEKEKCLEIGIIDFILKPLDKNLFEDVLLKWTQEM